ncbi:acetyltransferase [Stenotrophomonas maltophilia]|uniref:acetyltransferase n=1 Tax=Stenotrophomonas maltophilia TaxID=40324 RepID=UPI0006AA1150|nr:acetyltransferase [Stenotrophomonas maltophilia]ALA81066.1 hexapeptide transferase [Stenotrophomonas maltophilia]MBH1477542.1 acetyltransferase [Stenotrophomonas maltophilia]MBH1502604.1 acetyltransferase [Stenotrophomonas maltophilia]MBH1787465.1 acetyltransferase [Stenotrophomonas maltophilia]
MSRVAVVGAGGHAKVIIDLLRGGGHEVVACLDAGRVGQVVNGVPVLGDERVQLPLLKDQGVDAVFVALGDNRLRRKVAAAVTAAGLEMIPAVGRSAVISPSARIGQGCAIMEGAILNADVVVHDFAIINTNASVDHDCVVGAFAHVAPGSTLAGGVEVGASVFLGAGTRVIPGIKIADGATVGAGGVVVRDIDSTGTWVGVPARQIKIKD